MAEVPRSSRGSAGGAIDNATEEAEPMSLGRRSARILALVVIVAMIALWGYALWGPTEKTFPGHLADPAFATQAQEVCTVTAGQVDALAPAYATRESGARAEVLEEANGYLATMLENLSTIAPAADSGNDGRMIQAWLADWRTYLGDRERYVVALQDDDTARLYVSVKDGRQITEPIDFFAEQANEMANCVTPGDVA